MELNDAGINTVMDGMVKGKTTGRVVKQTKLFVLINRKFTNIEPSKVFKKAKFLFFCMIFVTSGMLAQTTLQNAPSKLSIQKSINPLPVGFSFSKMPLNNSVSTPFLSPNYYAAKLGFFCKQEIKFEKTVKIPFKFRLGTVEDCDRMEGKRKVR